MCTVSFISLNNKFVITSSRDENILRPVAFAPQEEIINGCKIIYPKDPKVGGTWFAINQSGAVAVLLNGAFEKHISQNNYSISRGLILLDIISRVTPLFHFEKMDLETIEPFTLILFEQSKLVELRWDGNKKYKTELNSNKNYIWSSATLYSKEAVKKRERWFAEYLSGSNQINEKTIIDFHSNNHNDSENGFIINRANTLKTFSITQALIEENAVSLNHIDLLNQKEFLITADTSRFHTIIQ